jgi:hypothetical protein
MLRVAVLRGCRRAELCGFRWADAELDKPYLDPVTGKARNGAVLTVNRGCRQSVGASSGDSMANAPSSAAVAM